MNAALYMRVSRDDLHCENQEIVLNAWWAANSKPGDTCTWYREEMSTRKTRPVKESVMQSFRDGKINTVVHQRIDRFARSVVELVSDADYVIQHGGRYVCVSNGFDFDAAHWTASQQLVFNIFASFAQFERDIIRERTIDGLNRVRAQGKRLGRPRKTPPANPAAVVEEAGTSGINGRLSLSH